MGRKIYLPLILASFFISTLAIAQSGEIRGKVIEKGTNEPIPFASVAVFSNGAQVLGAVADMDGNYSIKPLNPGSYDVKATSVGYTQREVSGVQVSVDKATFVNMELPKGEGVDLDEVVIVWEKPLIDIGNPATSQTMTFVEIQSAPIREVNAIAAQTAGVYTSGREGDDLNIRGSRGDATAYYVDGIKVRGNLGVSTKAAEQITTITGGVPAQYGDATGGIISVTTRGPSKEWTGGVELVSSDLFDEYNYRLGAFSLSGPIYTKRDSVGQKSGQPLIGFFLAGDYNYEKDRFPSAVPLYKINDDVLQDIQKNPLVKSPTGFGFNRKAEYLTYDDMETIGYHQNIPQNTYRLNGKLDFRPANNLYVSAGGSFEYVDQKDFSRIYELFNYDNNSHTVSNTYRVFGKLTHRFGDQSSESKSDIRNAFYTIQGDYTNYYTKTENSQHKDQLFNYGYVGKFTSYRSGRYFQFAGNPYTTYLGDASDSVLFVRSELNPLTANYTSQYYDLAPGIFGYSQDITDIPENGGLINGDNRVNQSVYGLFAATGRVPTGYAYANQAQAHFSVQGSADIKKHNVIVGVEYERRTDRLYQVLPSLLWDAMRITANANNQNLDLANPIFSAGGDTLNYNYLYVPTTNIDSQAAPGFFENVRNKIGVSMTEWVDIDALDPSTFDLSMFTTDQLIERGVLNRGTYGYDQYGNSIDPVGGLDGFNDFLTEKDGNNNFIRAVPAFKPIYAAGYISDRFTLDDLIFNVGLRVDFFDANQPALIDKYNLYKTYSAGELSTLSSSHALYGTEVPSNIGSDYVVYVNDINNPTKILGYRNEDHWYNAEGSEINNVNDVLINDPSNSAGTIQPFIVDPIAALDRKINTNAFKNYERQTSFMPRIAFSFPISDEAYFAAHYDILTQRPPNAGLLRFNPWTYHFMAQGVIPLVIANPDLKPEKTTNYEISFQQKLSSNSAFTIAAFYKELQDMIQIVNVPHAYPKAYTTYGNIDFGTAKGLTFTYDLRRSGNVRMNIAYTLQFANGTGSDPAANFGLISQSTDMTNLREPKPLDFDQRHTINVSLDYHYGSGKSYNGPIWGGKQVFSNAGVNILMTAGSGTPYTAVEEPYQTQDPLIAGRTTLDGSVNGSRLPWQFNLDLKFDKSFNVKMGKKPDGSNRKSLAMNVYLLVLNALDSKIVTYVYPATGNPDDDGYLASSQAQNSINGQISPESYRTFYSISMNDPANYLPPRRVRLGLQVNF